MLRSGSNSVLGDRSTVIDKIVFEDSERLPMFADGTAGNHLTMTVLCMRELGATDAEIKSFEESFLEERRDQLPFLKDIPPEQMCTANDINIDNWQTRLGDRRQLSNLRSFFRRQLGDKDIRIVLAECLPALEPWIHYGQVHPLLRIYFSAVFCDSKYLLVADGLAYLSDWASSKNVPPAAPLPESDPSAAQWTAEDLDTVWASLRNVTNTELLAVARNAVAASDKVQEAKEGVDSHPQHDVATVFASGIMPTLPEFVQVALTRPGVKDVSAFDEQAVPFLLPQICHLAVSMFLAVPRGSTLHGVTVTQCIAHLCHEDGILPSQLQATLLTRIWIWLTGLYVDKGVTPASFLSQEHAEQAESRADWDWQVLSRKAIASGQVHIIKLVVSCRWAYEHLGADPLYRLAAARAVEGGHPWRADVALESESLLNLSEEALTFRMEMKGKAVRYVSSLLDASSGDGINAWEQAWRECATPWDLSAQRNQVLQNHTTPPHVSENARCLVPGCGGGRDILELLEGGKNRIVHGIEISETATAVANANVSTPGRDTQVFAADFFDFASPDGCTYDLVFDYTFFCALPLNLRIAWGVKMSQLICQQTGKLLTYIWPPAPLSTESDEKPKGPPKGPPYPVSIDDYTAVLLPAGFYLEHAEACTLDQGRMGVAAWWHRSAQNDQDIDDINKVYSFWFRGEGGSYNFDAVREGFEGKSQGRFWMMTVDQAIDDAIREEFLEMFEQVTIHDKNAPKRWMETPRGCVALTVLVDQLPRNMFRGTPRSFATDALAIQAADAGLTHMEKWNLLDLDPFRAPLNLCERWFLSLAFTHSEDAQHQQKGIEILQSLLPEAVPSPDSSDPISSASASNDLTLSQVEANIRQSEAHAKLIEQYGRFPYRDEILGREQASDYQPTQRFERSVSHKEEDD